MSSLNPFIALLNQTKLLCRLKARLTRIYLKYVNFTHKITSSKFWMGVFVNKLLLKDRLFVRISRYSITLNELNKFSI